MTKKCCICQSDSKNMYLQFKDNYKEDTKYICDDCLTKKPYRHCERCDTYFHNLKDNFIKGSHNDENTFWRYTNHYCLGCYDLSIKNCKECGTVLLKQHMKNKGNNYYCPECYPYIQFKQPTLTFNDGRDNKHPIQRYWGVELEVSQVNFNKRFKLPKDSMFQDIGIVHDGSLPEGGIECVTPPARREKIEQLLKGLTKALREADGEITKDAGLHIHLDARTITESEAKKIYLLYRQLQDILFLTQPESRRDNRYCFKLEQKLDTVLYKPFLIGWYGTDNPDICKYNSSRYYFLNLNSYYYRQTIEIRLHSGSLNTYKILKWIEINERLIDFAIKTPLKRILKISGDSNTLFNLIGKKNIYYFKKRMTEYKKRGAKRIIIKRKPKYIEDQSFNPVTRHEGSIILNNFFN